uniref:Uncharacterized protein n=1 Tax=Rhizophora mucronata TaxID=61149 RepID=A0A2P2QZH5_RHIMU
MHLCIDNQICEFITLKIYDTYLSEDRMPLHCIRMTLLMCLC